MSVIIFIFVLALLIFVHELGHFLAAKISKVRVDAFAVGFPPKLFAWKPQKSDTTYSLNLIPFGGYVKIFGEDPDDESINGPNKERSFVHKPKLIQIWILIAGVLFNFIFAWLLISIGFMSGVPTAITEDTKGVVGEPELLLTAVVSDSPAEDAGLHVGDTVLGINTLDQGIAGEAITVESVQAFIKENGTEVLAVTYLRDGEEATTRVTPEEGIVEGQFAIGVGLDMVGIVQLNPFVALWEGGKSTARLTGAVTVGLVNLIGDMFKGEADLSQVSGPVGIVGLVGDASSRGLIALFTFTAFISLNLAVLNLLPFPALDGGRILFVIIEAIKGSPIKSKVANTVNAIGFALLLLLMVIVTVSDVLKLF